MPQTAAGRRKKTGILLIILVSLALNGAGVWYGLPSKEGWAPDEILPHDVQRGAARHFSNDWYRKYPPLQYYLLALVETPFVIYAKLRGLDLRGIPLNSAMILAGRLLSLFMAAGVVFFIYKCGREMFDERSSLFAAGIAALLVPFVYYAKTANLDVPYLFWFVISLFIFLRLLKTRQRKYYLLFALTAVLTVCTKDQAYALYILPPFVALFTDWKFQKRALVNLTIFRFLRNPAYLYALAVAVGAFCLIHNLAFNAQGFLHHLKLITGPASQNFKAVSPTLAGHLNLAGRAFSQIRFSLGWPLLAVCAAGLIRSLVIKPRNFLLLSLLSFAVSYDIFYIHVILFSFSRFYLPVCLILSLFGGQFLASVLTARSRLVNVSRVAAAAVFLYSIFYAFSLDVFMIRDSRYAAERWMRQNISSQATIGLAVPRVYAPRVEDYRIIRLPLNLPRFLNLASKPDFIIVNGEFSRRFKPGTGRWQFFQQFDRGKERYDIVFRYQTPLSWLPLKHKEVLKQINTINPEILIYKKAAK